MSKSIRGDSFVLFYADGVMERPVLWESHCHAQYEMISVLQGDVSIMLEGRSYRLTENQTVIIPPLLYHTVTANKKGVYRRVTALFDVAAVPAEVRERFLRKENELTIFFSTLADAFRRICEAGDPTFHAPLAKSLMIQLFYEAAEAKSTDTGCETDGFLQKIILYIDRHLCERILLADLAAHTSRSKSSVCHLFEEKMGVSPKQYILQKKLALADKLIRDGTPPTLAAMQVGFENYSSFYRVYRKRFGEAPTKRGKVHPSEG